jgi:hypothetical protein
MTGDGKLHKNVWYMQPPPCLLCCPLGPLYNVNIDERPVTKSTILVQTRYNLVHITRRHRPEHQHLNAHTVKKVTSHKRRVLKPFRPKRTHCQLSKLSFVTKFVTYISPLTVIFLLFMSMVWDSLWTAATNGPVFHLPDDIWVWRATVEWYWQGKTEELEEKPVPVPFYPPQIPHDLSRALTQAFVVRGRRLTAWAMARQCC